MITEKNSLYETAYLLNQESCPLRIYPGDFTAEEMGENEEEKEMLRKIMGNLGFAHIPIERITDVVPDWSWRSILKGVRFVEEQLKMQPVFYEVYPKEDADKEKKEVDLAAFPLNHRAGFVLICPGGGYKGVCSMAEGYPLAYELNRMGYAAFVLRYRTGIGNIAPKPQEDVAAALQYILDRRDFFQIDPGHFALMGFSAGGHLAASMCTCPIGLPRYGLPRPECLILGYPVITMGEFANEGSRDSLIGLSPDPEQIELYSVEKQIDREFPDVFMWQCEADHLVPIQNTQIMETALREKKIPFEYRIFHGKSHGWGDREDTEAAGWIQDAVHFWENRKGRKPVGESEDR